MHNLETSGLSSSRFESGDTLAQQGQRITPNHISQRYEDYDSNCDNVDEGKLQ